jgi:hypothetical protein
MTRLPLQLTDTKTVVAGLAANPLLRAQARASTRVA